MTRGPGAPRKYTDDHIRRANELVLEGNTFDQASKLIGMHNGSDLSRVAKNLGYKLLYFKSVNYKKNGGEDNNKK